MGSAPAPAALQGRKILVVDDDPGMAGSVCRHLEREGLLASSLTDPVCWSPTS